MGPSPELSPVELHHYSSPGCPLAAAVPGWLLESFRELVFYTSEARQGILCGEVSGAVTSLRTWRAAGQFNQESMRRAITGAPDPAIVGCYRIRDGTSLKLTREELQLAGELFANPGSLVLLMERRGPLAAAAGFFFFQNGAFREAPLIPFSLDMPPQVPSQPRQTPPPRPAAQAALPLPARPRRKKSGSRLSLLAIAISVALLYLSAALYLNRPRNTVLSEAPAPIARPESRRILRAERQGDDLKIMWDLNAPAIAAATAGALDIDDGGAKRTISMDADEVRSGSLLYTPVSSQISVTMTARKADETTAQASVLVLLSKTPQAQMPAPAAALPVAALPVATPPAPTAAPPVPVPPSPAAPHESLENKAERQMASRAFVPPQAQTVPKTALADMPPPPELDFGLPPAAGVPAPLLAAQAILDVPKKAAPQTKAADYAGPVLLSQAGVHMPAELPRIVAPMQIRVRVDINEAGKVTHAQALPAKGVHALLLQAAVDAAWKCRFQPARRGQTAVASSATLVFHLGPQI